MSKSRGEELLETLVNGEDSDIKPQSRMEEYLLAAIKKSGTDGLPKPISRGDALLHQLVDVVSNGSGGGGDTPITPVGEETVNFYDYDGTLVHSYTVEEAQALEELPELPTREGFTYQGWNWSLEEIKSHNSAVDVGAMCITSDGKTRVYIHLEEGRTSPKVAIGLKGTVSVDWGDGTEPDIISDTNLQGSILTPAHNYATSGDYVISISVISGEFSFASDYQKGCMLLIHDKNYSDGPNEGYRNCIQKVEIGNGITSIKERSFYNCNNLKNINIPLGITSIGQYAFYSTDVIKNSLEFISIPTNVTSIGNYAFQHCRSLKTVTLPNSLTSLGDAAFGYNSSLKRINIPKGITSIKGSLFSGCTLLENVNIPDSVTSIAQIAFYGCSSLKTIEIPDSVTSIGFNAFNGCSSLKTIKIPDGVTSIGNKAFYGCKSLEFINIPNDVTSISDGFFYDCSSLKTIKIPDGVTSIGKESFKNCSSLKTIEIPDSVTSIGDSAFSNCISLKSANLPEGLTSIGKSAFEACKLLTDIELPSSLTSLESRSFIQCLEFRRITIPIGVTAIGTYTFSGCLKLLNVTVLGTLTSIETYSFNTCGFVKYYDFSNHTTVPTLVNKSAFENIAPDCEILVPASLYDEWIAATNWSTLADNIKVKESA